MNPAGLPGERCHPGGQFGKEAGDIAPTSSCCLPLANPTHNPEQGSRRKWETEAERMFHHCVYSPKVLVVVVGWLGLEFCILFCIGFGAGSSVVFIPDLDIREGW